MIASLQNAHTRLLIHGTQLFSFTSLYLALSPNEYIINKNKVK